jgi:hypothetical protein
MIQFPVALSYININILLTYKWRLFTKNLQLYKVHKTREYDNIDGQERKQENDLVYTLIKDLSHDIQSANVTR